jgi:hypothetical protein
MNRDPGIVKFRHHEAMADGHAAELSSHEVGHPPDGSGARAAGGHGHGRSTMSESSLAEKLRIKPGSRTALFNAPKGFAALLDPLPDGAAVSASPRGDCGVVLGFVETLAAATSLVPRLTAALADGGVLWICYPKLTSSRAGELSRDVLWNELSRFGLRPVAMIALDDTWSAMRVVPET